jgi:hypothetical protein
MTGSHILLDRRRREALERRVCTAASPMQRADKDLYWWGHPDAVKLRPFFNLVLYECPNCKMAFTCFPPPEPEH